MSITIFKAVVKTQLDYGDVLYDQAFNQSFHQKPESIPREKIYRKISSMCNQGPRTK